MPPPPHETHWIMIDASLAFVLFLFFISIVSIIQNSQDIRKNIEEEENWNRSIVVSILLVNWLSIHRLTAGFWLVRKQAGIYKKYI